MVANVGAFPVARGIGRGAVALPQNRLGILAIRSLAVVRRHWVLSAPILIFLIASIAYSLTVPALEYQDELGHYEYITTIASGGGIPSFTDPARITSPAHHPPLYYGLLAGVSSLAGLEPTFRVPPLNTRFDWSPGAAETNLRFQHGMDELFPFAGQPRRIHLLRFASILMGAATIVLIYKIGLTLVPGHRWPALGAATIAATVPQFTFMSGAINNDSLAIALSTAALLVMVRMVRRQQASWVDVGLLGIVLGLAFLTKYTTVFLGVLAVVAIILAGGGHKRILGRIGVASGIALAISGWFYVRNMVLYGDPLAWKAQADAYPWLVLDRSLTDGYFALEGAFWQALLRSSFVPTGWIDFGVSGWAVVLFVLILLAGIVGVGVLVVRRATFPWFDRGLVRSMALLGLAIIAVIAGVVYYSTVFPQPQGRFLFPAIGAASVLVALGLGVLGGSSGRRSTAVVAVAVVAFASINVASMFRVQPALSAPLLPVYSAGQPVEIGRAIVPRVRVEEIAEITGYEVATQIDGALSVTLAYHVVGSSLPDMTAFVHLVDSRGERVAQDDRRPDYETSWWHPGETVLVPLRLKGDGDLGGVAPYWIQTGIYLSPAGERLRLSQGGQPLKENWFRLPVVIEQSAGGALQVMEIDFAAAGPQRVSVFP